jgi:hypothetical protein
MRKFGGRICCGEHGYLILDNGIVKNLLCYPSWKIQTIIWNLHQSFKVSRLGRLLDMLWRRFSVKTPANWLRRLEIGRFPANSLWTRLLEGRKWYPRVKGEREFHLFLPHGLCTIRIIHLLCVPFLCRTSCIKRKVTLTGISALNLLGLAWKKVLIIFLLLASCVLLLRKMLRLVLRDHVLY